jgi:hypothetical protein
MSNQYTQPNAAERAHLEKVITRLSLSDYGRAAGGPGWTIGGLLAHLTFWDNRARVLLAKWKKDGIGPSLIDTDLFNESMRPLCNAVPAAVIAKMAVETAAAIDQEVDSLSPDFLAKVEREGTPVRLNRGLHRAHHLAQVEKALA